jgi:hypothetical protein
MHTQPRREFHLSKAKGSAKPSDPSVGRPLKTRSSRFTHAERVDSRSTRSQADSTHRSTPSADTLDPMGDERHKKSPPPAELEEDVTESFRREVRDTLTANHARNKALGLRKEDPGYWISYQSELADAIETDKNLIKNMLGGVRPGTKVKLINRSVYVGPIRSALNLRPVRTITVPSDRAEILLDLANVPDAEWRGYADAVRESRRRLGWN